MSNFYKVGKIVNTHGVRGEVRVITSSDFAAERYQPGNLIYFFRDDRAEGIPLTISGHRTHKNFDLLTFEQHPSINDVEKYKGGFLKIKDRDEQELDEGEFYYDQIIGCEVITDTGEQLGKVKEILSPGANDVWVVQPYEKGKDILLPYIDDVVKDVQIKEKKIIVHIIEGLI
jgi:16S rRNA processing protein RimM